MANLWDGLRELRLELRLVETLGAGYGTGKLWDWLGNKLWDWLRSRLRNKLWHWLGEFRWDRLAVRRRESGCKASGQAKTHTKSLVWSLDRTGIRDIDVTEV